MQHDHYGVALGGGEHDTYMQQYQPGDIEEIRRASDVSEMELVDVESRFVDLKALG